MLGSVIEALVRFARVVSDADGAEDVLGRLAHALHEHVCPDGVAVYALGDEGKLRLAAERGLGEAARLEVDVDDIETLAEKLCSVSASQHVAHVSRPLVARAGLYGYVVMLHTSPRPDTSFALADGFIDLAAVALSTASHVNQLERQFAELREQQELLARSEKLRALGQMAAGVSHDLRNILNPLSLHLQVISMALERRNIDDAKESVDEMKGVLQRGLQTVERLRGFSRQNKDTKKELVELDRLAREALSIGKTRAASDGRRVPRIREELGSSPATLGVSSEIVSALVNLIVNAIDAMAEKGGTLTIRSGGDDAESWVEVADDGPGMSPDIAKLIFDPFFTTKGQEGTGLGLAMVREIAQRHGGTVTVDTEEGRGATFRFSIPGLLPQT